MKARWNWRGLSLFTLALALIVTSRLLPSLFETAGLLLGCLLLAEVELKGQSAMAAVVLTICVVVGSIGYVVFAWPDGRNGGWVIWFLVAIILFAGGLISSRHWRTYRLGDGGGNSN